MSMLGIFFFITNSFACVTLALSQAQGWVSLQSSRAGGSIRRGAGW